MKIKSKIAQQVRDIYLQIDSQPNDCDACGKCCDFTSFDHRLFVTTPELIYFAMNIPHQNILPMAGGACPYNIDGKCTVYDHRFAGCRIFCCKSEDNHDDQHKLSETTLEKFKTICKTFDIPYNYMDLNAALNRLIHSHSDFT